MIIHLYRIRNVYFLFHKLSSHPPKVSFVGLCMADKIFGVLTDVVLCLPLFQRAWHCSYKLSGTEAKCYVFSWKDSATVTLMNAFCTWQIDSQARSLGTFVMETGERETCAHKDHSLDRMPSPFSWGDTAQSRERKLRPSTLLAPATLLALNNRSWLSNMVGEHCRAQGHRHHGIFPVFSSGVLTAQMLSRIHHPCVSLCLTHKTVFCKKCPGSSTHSS